MSKLSVNECYFHSIVGNANYALTTLERIIISGNILSRKRLHQRNANQLNSDEDICLVEYSPLQEKTYGRETSGFSRYTTHFLSLILDDKTGPIKRLPYKPVFSDIDLIKDENFVTFCDEVHVQDAISLNHLIGVSVPYSRYVDRGEISFLAFCDQQIVDFYCRRKPVDGTHPLHKDMSSFDINCRTIREQYILNYLKAVRTILEKYQVDVPIYTHQIVAGKDTFKVYQK